VVSARVPVRSTEYACDNVRLTLDCVAGETFPLGPLMVYDGSAFGAVPSPAKVIEVVFTIRVPLLIPVTVGAKVIVKGYD